MDSKPTDTLHLDDFQTDLEKSVSKIFKYAHRGIILSDFTCFQQQKSDIQNSFSKAGVLWKSKCFSPSLLK